MNNNEDKNLNDLFPCAIRDKECTSGGFTVCKQCKSNTHKLPDYLGLEESFNKQFGAI